MGLVSILGSVALIHLLAISSPGPTFVVVTRYAAAGDRRAGLLVALGVCLATLTWASFAATGLSAFVIHFPRAYAAIQYAGAAYLAWMGLKLLHGFFRAEPSGRADAEPTAPATALQAVTAGYLTNISNPKVIAYYTSLFGVMVPANASWPVFGAIVMTVLAVSAFWWIIVALFFSLPVIRDGFLRIRRWLDALMGGILIALGAKLALGR